MNKNATASWSGYAHQGKIGLLIALRKMNAIFDPTVDYNNYSLAYETQEDVNISDGATVLEVHQVKALTTTTTIGGYTTALKNFLGCTGANYLHTICAITNWNNLTKNENPSLVERFVYAESIYHCPLDALSQYIDQEIKTFLLKLNHPEENNYHWRVNVFQEYLFILDNRIRYEHQHHDQQSYNICFTFAEIAQLLTHPPTKIKSKLHTIRKNIYEKYETFILDLPVYEQELTADHQDKVIKTIEKIYELPDDQFIEFLRNINPHTTGGKVFETSEIIEDFYNGQNFYETFLRTLIKVTGSELLMDEQRIPSYFKGTSYLLTSINTADFYLPFCARNILENSQINFSRYESDFIINQRYSGKLFDCATKLIPKDGCKFFNCKDMSFLPIEDTVNQINP